MVEININNPILTIMTIIMPLKTLQNGIEMYENGNKSYNIIYFPHMYRKLIFRKGICTCTVNATLYYIGLIYSLSYS